MITHKKLIQDVVIVAAKRSAIASFGTSLASISARDFGTQVLKDCIAQCNIDINDIGKVFLGNVLGAGQGQNIARQVAIDSGIPHSAPACTINQVCGSGLQSVILAAQSIQLGEDDMVVAGGVENMSQAAYVLPKARWGARMGNATLIDTLIQDGLWDAFEDYHMGHTAEHIATRWQISREQQDQFALDSQQKATRAQADGQFKEEITPIVIPQRKGAPLVFDKDEYIRKDADMASLAKLKPAFVKDGTVTAGNASGINDGAAILILASTHYAHAHGLPILARLCAYNSKGLAPEIMGFGPAESIKTMTEEYNIDLASIDRFELNEAFASQSLAVLKDLHINKEKVNKKGGAIALGHPIGASGARILCTLLYGMKQNNENAGIASLCVGGGMGVSVYISRE